MEQAHAEISVRIQDIDDTAPGSRALRRQQRDHWAAITAAQTEHKEILEDLNLARDQGGWTRIAAMADDVLALRAQRDALADDTPEAAALDAEITAKAAEIGAFAPTPEQRKALDVLIRKAGQARRAVDQAQDAYDAWLESRLVLEDGTPAPPEVLEHMSQAQWLAVIAGDEARVAVPPPGGASSHSG